MNNLIRELELTAAKMKNTSIIMEGYPSFKIQKKAKEMAGAAELVADWVETIKAEANRDCEVEDWEGQLSNCCGAPIFCHDCCTACKEHCEPREEEE